MRLFGIGQSESMILIPQLEPNLDRLFTKDANMKQRRSTPGVV